jgi:LCP family protein required for cell wall assembly
MSGDRQTWWTRLVALQNVISVLTGIAIFVIGLRFWDTTLGVVLSAVAASLASGLVWVLWWYTKGPEAAAKVLDTVHLGTADKGQGAAPTLFEAGSAGSQRYHEIVTAIESQTTGQVLLISPTQRPSRPSTVAVNLAAAATQIGRRVVLVDGAINGSGLSRYSSTGTGAGLSDLAAGDTPLDEASQVWRLDDGSLLPVVTAGSGPDGDDPTLDGLNLADAFDVIAERADLVFIDSPPVTNGPSTAQLAAHADGSILLVEDTASTGDLIEAQRGLEAAGAPVVGYITDHSETGRRRSPWLRMLRRSGAAFLLITLIYTAFTAVSLWSSWAGVERVTLDTERARAVTAPAPPPVSDLVGDYPIEEVVIAEPAPAEGYRSFLLIGTDDAAGIADVILLTVLPADGSEPFIVSLPRDLYVPNTCSSGYIRINATLHDCGQINGPTRLAVAVEDFTGIAVDHFALFNFEGFADIVDGVGGIEICVDNERRDWRAELHLPAGCTMADGPTALAWVRSRHPREKVDGTWQAVSGASDLFRNQTQQDVVLQLLDKLKTFDSPADLARKVNDLSAAFVLDDRLGIADAIALAWSLRNLDITDINRLEVPVVYATTQNGQSVLRATRPFHEVLAELYPHLLEAAAQDGPSVSD